MASWSSGFHAFQLLTGPFVVSSPYVSTDSGCWPINFSTPVGAETNGTNLLVSIPVCNEMLSDDLDNDILAHS